MATPATIPTIDPFSLLSIMMVQIGARHLSFELTEFQQKLIKHPLAKAVILFCLVYASTKDIKISLIIVIIIFILLNYLLNENSPYSLISEKMNRNLKQIYKNKFVNELL